jgi:hypothetical protein
MGGVEGNRYLRGWSETKGPLRHVLQTPVEPQGLQWFRGIQPAFRGP